MKVTPPVFRSGFESGVNVTPNPVTTNACVGPDSAPLAEKKYQVNLTGTESATGTVWPPSFWGPPNVVLMNTSLLCANTFSEWLDVKTRFVSLNGQTTRILSSTVINASKQTDGNIARLGLGYSPQDVSNIPGRFYVRRYLRYSEALENPGASKWFVQHEFKNTSCDIPRRLTLYLMTNAASVPFYRLRMDQENNCGVPNSTAPVPEFPDLECYPRQSGAPCPDFTVMAGSWFYDEYFVQYSTGGSSTDRVAYAINGQVIFDYQGPLATAKPKGIKLTPGYLNISNVEVHADDLEVYHDFPCRTFPCGAPSHY